MILTENQLLADGAYRVDSFIARGGMAEIWRVEHVESGHTRAMKVLSRKSLAHADVVERFKLEYDMLLRLNHPHIVTVYDFGWHNDKEGKLPWYTMDYYPFNLRQRLPQVSIGEGIRLILPILDALDFAHQKKICHRDLKPMNILVDAEGRSALTDFGIAKEMDKNRNLTGRNIIGTATYISPEQCLGVPVVPASDVYSMGVILYQLATGRFPFEDPSDITVIQKHIKEAPSEVRSLNSAISDELQAGIMKCLAKRPEDRYVTALDLKRDLRACPELSEAAERVLKPGDLLHDRKYRVITMIEQGGFAEVYRVKNVKTGKPFALKILMPALTYDPESLKRFEREISILKSLDHPNIIKVVDDGHFESAGRSLPYFVMRYFPGNLQAAMSESLDSDKALTVMIDVLEALEISHQSKVFHRDLKPSNILISADGHGFLTDFGIAKISNKGLNSIVTRSATMTRAAIGTSAYMAPEQIRNDPVDARADIYSIGIILHELCTGQKPFDAKSQEEITAMHLYVAPTSARSQNPAVSEALDEVVTKCLAKEPDKRFQDVPALIRSLVAAQYKGKWFGERAPTKLSMRRLGRIARRSFRTAGPYLGAFAAVAAFAVGMAGAMVHRHSRIGLPETGLLDPGAYRRAVVENIANRRQRLIAALETPPSASAPAPSELNRPPELVPDTDPAKPRLIALMDARRGATDPAIAARLDARIRAIAARAETPEIALAATPETIQSPPNVPAKLRVDLRNPRAELAFQYPWELFEADAEGRPAGAAIRTGLSEAPTFEIDELRLDRKYVLAVKPRFESKIAGGGVFEAAGLANHPGGFDFSVVTAQHPVEIAKVPNRDAWRLANAADEGFTQWIWRLTPEAGGEPVEIADPEFVLTDELYERLDEGRYSIACLAASEPVDREQPNYPYSATWGESLLVDRTAPTLTVASTERVFALLPNDPIEVGVSADAGWGKSAELTLSVDGDISALEGGALALHWRDPGEAPIGRSTYRVEAIDLAAREDYRLSEAVEIEVISLGRSRVELLDRWEAQRRRLRGGAANYARAMALMPDGPWVELNDGDRLSRAWLTAHAEASETFDRLKTFLDERDALMEQDQFLTARADSIRRVAASVQIASNESIPSELDRLIAEWPAQSDRAVTARAYLQPIERRLLPTVPADPAALETVRMTGANQNPLESHYQLKQAYLDAASESLEYQYVFLTEAPPEDDAARAELLRAHRQAQRARFATYAPPDDDLYTRAHYLIARVTLADPAGDDPFASPIAFHQLEPLISIDEDAERKLAEFGDLSREIRVQTGGQSPFARTQAWLAAERERGNELVTPDQRASLPWLIRNQQNPQSLAQLDALIATLKEYRDGDRAFNQERASRLQAASTGWTPEHRAALDRRLLETWSAPPKPPSTRPADHIDATIAEYKTRNADSLLVAPSAPASPIAIPAGEAPVVNAEALGLSSTDNVYYAWVQGSALPAAGAASSRLPAVNQGLLRLAAPEAQRDGQTYTLAMRTEAEDGPLRLKSEWRKVGEYTKALPRTPAPTPAATPQRSPTPAPTPEPTGDPTIPTKSEAEAFAQRMTASLPQPRSTGRATDQLFGDYISLFETAGGGEASSLFKFFDGTLPGSGVDRNTAESLRLQFQNGRNGAAFIGFEMREDLGEGRFACFLHWQLSGSRRHSTLIVKLRKSPGGVRIVEDSDFKYSPPPN